MSRAHCPSSVQFESDPTALNFVAENVFLDACDQQYNYWAPASIGGSFTIDYGCPIFMTKFAMKNSQGYNDDRLEMCKSLYEYVIHS